MMEWKRCSITHEMVGERELERKNESKEER